MQPELTWVGRTWCATSALTHGAVVTCPLNYFWLTVKSPWMTEAGRVRSKALHFVSLDSGSVTKCSDNQSKMGVQGFFSLMWNSGRTSFQIASLEAHG